jgi:hypothetical protein
MHPNKSANFDTDFRQRLTREIRTKSQRKSAAFQLVVTSVKYKARSSRQLRSHIQYDTIVEQTTARLRHVSLNVSHDKLSAIWFLRIVVRLFAIRIGWFLFPDSPVSTFLFVCYSSIFNTTSIDSICQCGLLLGSRTIG